VLRKCSAVPAPLVEPLGIFLLPSVILNLHTHIQIRKKNVSNEKFLDIRELDKNFIMYYKEPRYIEWKIRHLLVSLFAIPSPFHMISPAEADGRIATVHQSIYFTHNNKTKRNWRNLQLVEGASYIVEVEMGHTFLGDTKTKNPQVVYGVKPLIIFFKVFY